jgi:molecular chaperone DnaJ
MATKQDYYEILGVARNASEREIAAAYRKQAIKFHPDSNPGDSEATERFKLAAEAYEVLRDGEKRARYDRYGHAGVQGAAGPQFHDVEDIFEAFGDLGGLFGDIFGGGRRRSRRQRRGADIRCDVQLDLEEAARGVTKTVEFTRHEICDVCSGAGARPGSTPETCRRCGGRGQVVQQAGILRVQTACSACRGAGVVITDPCETCRGQGLVARTITKDVHIPAGVDDGNRVRIRGEGEASPDGGPPGDCYCFVSVRPHRLFQREGLHLILQMPITYSQAALGAVIEVPTLNGRAELKIPGGTQSGEVFRLRGRGMPDPHGAGVGDLAVQTFIETPKRLTPRQEELLRELADLEHAHVTPHRKTFLEKIRDYFSASDSASTHQES